MNISNILEWNLGMRLVEGVPGDVATATHRTAKIFAGQKILPMRAGGKKNLQAKISSYMYSTCIRHHLHHDRWVYSVHSSGCSGWFGRRWELSTMKLVSQCSYLLSHLQEAADGWIMVHYWTIANITSLHMEKMTNLDNDNSHTCAHVSALNPGFLIISHKNVNMGIK